MFLLDACFSGSLCHALLYTAFNLWFFGSLICVYGKGVSFVHRQWVMLTICYLKLSISLLMNLLHVLIIVSQIVFACFRMMKTSQ